MFNQPSDRNNNEINQLDQLESFLRETLDRMGSFLQQLETHTKDLRSSAAADDAEEKPVHLKVQRNNQPLIKSDQGKERNLETFGVETQRVGGQKQKGNQTSLEEAYDFEEVKPCPSVEDIQSQYQLDFLPATLSNAKFESWVCVPPPNTPTSGKKESKGIQSQSYEMRFTVPTGQPRKVLPPFSAWKTTKIGTVQISLSQHPESVFVNEEKVWPAEKSEKNTE